jgi:sulfhydrogenase subunit beta (sulfur reductase)
MTTTQLYEITKAALCQGIDKALTAYKVAAPTRKENTAQPLYDYISNSKQIEFAYQPTVLSPKKFFFPQEETIVEYTADGKVTAKNKAAPQVLFGVRPCDLNGIKLMDEAFAEGHGDPNYMAKREQTVVIGIECEKVCDKDAFCFKVKAQNAAGGFDILLAPNAAGDKFTAQVVTAKGQDFVSKYFATAAGDEKALQEFAARKEKGFPEKPFDMLDKLPELFEKHHQHPIWEQEGGRCLSCGSCIMGCPTCYCFDVVDSTELNLKKGARVRKWDACVLSSFAVVAGGENFRHSAIGRLHHRIDRKFNYLMRKHGQAVCVGCGRCVRACLPEISPKTIAEAIINTESGKSK